MLAAQKNKMNMKILDMLRDKGAPSASPFPGDKDFISQDHDLDASGSITGAGMQPELPGETEDDGNDLLADRAKLKEKLKKKSQGKPVEDSLDSTY